MRQRTRKTVALLLVILPLEIGHAQTVGHDYEDGSAFKAECDNINNLFFLGECEGYIEAIAGVVLGGNSVNGFRACLPDGVSVAQLKNIVHLYLTIHSVKLHSAASGLVAEALEDSYPCK